jgi:hypothetical protein
MTGKNSFSFSQYERIKEELRAMSELIRAARDKPACRGTSAFLPTQTREDEARVYDKNSKR